MNSSNPLRNFSSFLCYGSGHKYNSTKFEKARVTHLDGGRSCSTLSSKEGKITQNLVRINRAIKVTTGIGGLPSRFVTCIIGVSAAAVCAAGVGVAALGATAAIGIGGIVGGLAGGMIGFHREEGKVVFSQSQAPFGGIMGNLISLVKSVGKGAVAGASYPINGIKHVLHRFSDKSSDNASLNSDKTFHSASSGSDENSYSADSNSRGFRRESIKPSVVSSNGQVHVHQGLG